MTYKHKSDIYKHWCRENDKPKMEFKHQKKPPAVFKSVSVLEAIEQIKLNPKLVEKVSKVITSSLYDTYSTAYKDHIQLIAAQIREQKLF